MRSTSSSLVIASPLGLLVVCGHSKEAVGVFH